jgi:PAT family beta-lactamase induction signal transducer AmpG
LRAAVLDPFRDFLVRHRWHAVLVLSLIALYRISDVVMGVMSNPFYQDMGFTKDEVATVSKLYGVVMTMVGAFVGGLITLRIGVLKTLFVGGLLSAMTNLLFAWLATRGHDLTFLIIAISADNLAGGIATSAFVAYLSGLTSTAYSATQYALFSSVMLLLPKFLAGYSGLAVDTFGYVHFFIGTALLGMPVLVLIWLAARVEPPAAPAAPQR